MLLIRNSPVVNSAAASRPLDPILAKVELADFMHLNNWMFYSEAVLLIYIQVHLLLNEHMTNYLYLY